MSFVFYPWLFACHKHIAATPNHTPDHPQATKEHTLDPPQLTPKLTLNHPQLTVKLTLNHHQLTVIDTLNHPQLTQKRTKVTVVVLHKLSTTKEQVLMNAIYNEL